MTEAVKIWSIKSAFKDKFLAISGDFQGGLKKSCMAADVPAITGPSCL